MAERVSKNGGGYIFPPFFRLALLGGVAGLAVWMNFVRTDYVCVFSRAAGEAPSGAAAFILPVLFALLFCGGGALWRKKHPDRDMAELPKALSVSLLYTPFFFLPLGLYSSVAFVAVYTAVVFRVAALWRGAESFDIKISGRICLAVLICCAAGFIIWGTFFQVRMHRGLTLDYWDWGLFLNIVDNTLKGKWFFSNGLGYNYMGEHFSPGAVLLLAPYVRFFHSSEAFFVMCAAILAAPAFMIYFFAKQQKLPDAASLLLALGWLMCPAVFNMIPAVYNGFHLDYLTIPFIILFFWLYEGGKRPWAWFVFALSLTMKDTVSIFWLGAAAVMILRGRKRDGLILAGVSLLWFFFITKVVMLMITGKSQYNMIYRYSQLGSSYTEILLSPLQKPAVFWDTVLRSQNFYMLALLLLPVFILIFGAPEWLLAGSLIYVFVCLQGSPVLVSNYSWYQSEILGGLYAAAVLCFKKMSSDSPGRWARIATAGLHGDLNFRAAVFAAFLFGAGMCFYFYSCGCPPGKNIWTNNTETPLFTDVVEELKRVIPENKTLTASSRLAGHFLLRNDTFAINTPPKEWLLFDLMDTLMDSSEFEAYRRGALKRKLIYCRLCKNHCFLVYSGEPADKTPPKTGPVTTEDFKKSGASVAADSEIVSCAAAPAPGGNTRLGFRLSKKTGHDIFLKVITGDGTRLVIPWEYGIWPAYLFDAGHVFSADINTAAPVTAVEVICRPPPDGSLR